MTDITKRDWQQVIYDAYDNGATSPATLKGIATIIRQLCRHCAAAGWISDADVPVHFAMPRAAKLGSKTILQPDQIRLLFDREHDGHWYVPVFRFLVLTGLRRGELCALQTARDLDGDTLTVRESLSHEGITVTPKSADSQRTIALSALAVEQLELHRQHRRQAGVVSPYLFCDLDAGQIAARRLGNAWRSWREEHGITITLHELRHTHISYSRQRTSLGLDDLRPLYGHSRDMDTDRVYVHDIAMTAEEREVALRKRREIASQVGAVFDELLTGGD